MMPPVRVTPAMPSKLSAWMVVYAPRAVVGAGVGDGVATGVAPAVHVDLPNSYAPTSGAAPAKPSVYGVSTAPRSMAGDVARSWKFPAAGSTNCGSVPGQWLFDSVAPVPVDA